MTTIGVAIAVPEPWAGELQRYRSSFGDPLAAAIPTHVTLVPPTLISYALDKVGRHLSDVAGSTPRFPLRLRGTATFRPTSPVVFIALAEGISSCEMLAGAIRQGPLAQDLTFPYRPHVTVAHDIADAALDVAFERLADYSCAFDVTAFHLYIHGDDGVWRPERSFTLAS
ncbi:MAG: 2'-5' RNA ligase family protein [Actinomycetota bacterium]|nr:2'-5' RNA ligase family protein [Actinomycetota bacterium]